MNKQVTPGQLISSIVTIVMALITAWMTMKADVATLKTKQDVMQAELDGRIKAVEQKQVKNDADDAIERDKADKFREEMRNKMTEILIQVKK